MQVLPLRSSYGPAPGDPLQAGVRSGGRGRALLSLTSCGESEVNPRAAYDPAAGAAASADARADAEASAQARVSRLDDLIRELRTTNASSCPEAPDCYDPCGHPSDQDIAGVVDQVCSDYRVYRGTGGSIEVGSRLEAVLPAPTRIPGTGNEQYRKRTWSMQLANTIKIGYCET